MCFKSTMQRYILYSTKLTVDFMYTDGQLTTYTHFCSNDCCWVYKTDFFLQWFEEQDDKEKVVLVLDTGCRDLKAGKAMH